MMSDDTMNGEHRQTATGESQNSRLREINLNTVAVTVMQGSFVCFFFLSVGSVWLELQRVVSALRNV